MYVYTTLRKDGMNFCHPLIRGVMWLRHISVPLMHLQKKLCRWLLRHRAGIDVDLQETRLLNHWRSDLTWKRGQNGSCIACNHAIVALLKKKRNVGQNSTSFFDVWAVLCHGTLQFALQIILDRPCRSSPDTSIIRMRLSCWNIMRQGVPQTTVPNIWLFNWRKERESECIKHL